MIEIYTNTNERLELRTYISGVRVNADNVSITLTDAGTGDVLQVSTAATTVTGEAADTYTYVVPLEHTTSSRVIKALWEYEISGEAGQSLDYIEVVAPYTTPDEIINTYPEFATGGSNEKTFDQLKDMERTVRNVIDTFCSQSFYRQEGITKTMLGHDSESLLLTSRLWSLDSVQFEETDITEFIERDSDNYWALRHKQTSDDAIKRNVENVFGRNYFRESRIYRVTGNWGWEYVPNGVNQAAKILIANAYCKEETYRQRYVDNLRAADFRIEFQYPSDETTGIAAADQMLYKYRVSNVVVI